MQSPTPHPHLFLTNQLEIKHKTPNIQNTQHHLLRIGLEEGAWRFVSLENFHIIAQLHLDSSFGGFVLSTLSGSPTIRGRDSSFFSSLSVLVKGGFASVSTRLCLDFWDFELRFPALLPCASFLSGLDFPNKVTVGREPSSGTTFSFSIAMVAAWQAKL